MKPAIITYYDSYASASAAITAETVQNFAQAFGWDWVDEHTGSVNKKSRMKKPELALRELEAGRPYVVWADCDIVFRKDVDTGSLMPYLEHSMSMMRTPICFETSFFIAVNSEQTTNLLRKWYQFGMSGSYKTDERALHMLNGISPSTRIMYPIDSTDSITSPFQNGGNDRWGKHFYTSTANGVFVHQMLDYKKAVFNKSG